MPFTFNIQKRIVQVLLRLTLAVIVFSASCKVIYAETDVYITRTGECYHTGGCSYLSNSKIPIGLDEAIKNYRPCSRCNPPTSLNVGSSLNGTTIYSEGLHQVDMSANAIQNENNAADPVVAETESNGGWYIAVGASAAAAYLYGKRQGEKERNRN